MQADLQDESSGQTLDPNWYKVVTNQMTGNSSETPMAPSNTQRTLEQGNSVYAPGGIDYRAAFPNGLPTSISAAPSVYEQGGITGGTQAQATRTPTAYQFMEGVDTGKLNDPNVTSPKYVAARILASGGSVAQAAAAVGGTVIDATRFRLPTGEIIDTRRDQEGANALQWLVTGDGSGDSGGSGSGATSGSGGPSNLARTGVGTGYGTTTGVGSVQGNNVFTDPATTDWETLLRALTDKLNQPQPTWTPAQLDLQQTQAIDPIERARQSRLQQETQILAQRGIMPGSGIYDAALRDINRQFDQFATQARSGFATQAINREDQVFNNNETRATNAVNLMQRIPTLADQRLAAAQSSIQRSDPYQLLALQNQIQQQQYNAGQNTQAQNQDFWTALANALAQAFQ